MKTTTTLLTFALLSRISSAQAPGDTLTMSFDDTGDLLQLDTLYPAGCWQVGHPNKPIFTSAYSEPNALVTDTLLPHAALTTCYAELTSTVDDQGYYGKWITFSHRMDMDSLQSFGWVETKAPFSGMWSRAGDWNNAFLYLSELTGDGLPTDTGVVFTGSNGSWTTVGMSLDCMTVVDGGGERGGGDPYFHVRFVFEGNANPNGRDGWMIDDVRLASRVCIGGVAEEQPPLVQISPDPVSTIAHVEVDLPEGQSYLLELVRADGSIALRELHHNDGSQTLDVSTLSDGFYVLRMMTGLRQTSARIIVQH